LVEEELQAVARVHGVEEEEAFAHQQTELEHSVPGRGRGELGDEE